MRWRLPINTKNGIIKKTSITSKIFYKGKMLNKPKYGKILKKHEMNEI